jgi:hypothetical protein
MKKASDEKLEDAIYLWFLQKRSQGKPVSGYSDASELPWSQLVRIIDAVLYRGYTRI